MQTADGLLDNLLGYIIEFRDRSATHENKAMTDDVQLVGLDFGTTTSGAVVASARLTRNAVTSRTELADVRERFRSPLVFTPLHGERLDEGRLVDLLDSWFSAGGVCPEAIFGGGALLTGLTAQKENAAALVRLIRARLGEALIATADDPCLESWLAFLGSCGALSVTLPSTPIVNLDVGGGTTNLALGVAGEVRRTGCLFVGARHVRVEPGTYRLVGLSRYARALFDALDIGKGPGDTLSESEVDAVLDFYRDLLDAAVTSRTEAFVSEVARLHEQVSFRLPANVGEVAVTFSGGVGELVYAHLRGEPWPQTTCFGDLGIDLAQRIVAHPRWAKSLRQYRPAGGGRATVYGLLRHSTEVSGSTIFLPEPSPLPLSDLPILGTIAPEPSDERLREILALVRASPRGGCLRIHKLGTDVAAVRGLGMRLHRLLGEVSFPPTLPLVLLVGENVGKALGHYVTAWGTAPRNLVVIDEVAERAAQYAQLGVPRAGVVPVSFYGLHPQGDEP